MDVNLLATVSTKVNGDKYKHQCTRSSKIAGRLQVSGLLPLTIKGSIFEIIGLCAATNYAVETREYVTSNVFQIARL